MKNHIKANGKILQTNKKWSHLRQRQKERIADWLCNEFISFVEMHHRRPKKIEHDEIIHVVMNKIREQDMWIPCKEVEKYYKSKVGKWYRKIEQESEM